jgi:hypothetical protein
MFGTPGYFEFVLNLLPVITREPAGAVFKPLTATTVLG